MGERGPAKKDYEGEGIVVHWDSSLCIHAAACTRGLPTVFDTAQRPWINLDTAAVQDIATTVDTCPSHALTYTRSDGGAEGPGSASSVPSSAVSGEVTVTVRANGPLVVMGSVRLLDDQGAELAAGDRHFLCRCGNSANKPQCDGSHKRVGFTG